VILTSKKWILPDELTEQDHHLVLSQRLLLSRGWKMDSIDLFLNKKDRVWHDPSLLPDMDSAVERILRAIQQHEHILVFGDYDADGITATALLIHFFRTIDVSCSYLIPDRACEGYGLSEVLVEKIRVLSPSLVVTVDCGVANIQEVSLICKCGIDVVITDHHEVKESLPIAHAVVNPKRKDNRYPFSSLAGVGVALKLVSALCHHLSDRVPETLWRSYLDFAAIGTVADVVPLLDENRTIALEGLSLLRTKKRPGIQALYDITNEDQKNREINSGWISFVLVPRINAAGRMSDASRAVELLLSDDIDESKRLAHMLQEDNQHRQEIEASILNEATQKIEHPEDGQSSILEKKGPIIIYGKNWHPGVAGIVASRLVTKYHRPTIVFSEDTGHDGWLKGSARAVSDYNILEAITYAKEYTMHFGGHPKAAGISLSKDQLAQFTEKMCEYRAEDFSGERSEEIQIDYVLTPSELTFETYEAMETLAPFGEGNREPRFLVFGLCIDAASPCGHGKHLKLMLSSPDLPDSSFEAVGFGLGNLSELCKVGERIDVVFEMNINVWMSRKRLSLQIIDFHFAKTGDLTYDSPEVFEKLYKSHLPLSQMARLAKLPVEKLCPSKDEVKHVYQFLRSNMNDGVSYCEISLLARLISAHRMIELTPFGLSRILEMFSEAGLLRIHMRTDSRIGFSLLFIDGKVKLDSTQTYRRIFAFGG